MCNRSTTCEECGGKFERITRRCDLEDTKGGWVVVSLETRLVGGDRGRAKLHNFHQEKPKCSVAAAVERAFVEAKGEGERNWLRGVERRIVGGGRC